MQRGFRTRHVLDRAASTVRTSRLSWRAATWLTVVGLVAMALVQGAWRQPPDPLEVRLDRLTAEHRFDLVHWEADAVRGKMIDLLADPRRGLTDEQAQGAVREYLQLAKRAGEIEDAIDRIYSDPTVPDPEAATRRPRSELETVRTRLASQARVVEAILEKQLAERIEALGLTTAGAVWPPPRFSFTEPPQMLVLSRRDRIERIKSVDLTAQLDSADRDRIEQGVAQEENISAYVTGIGGYGAYPTMVVDRYGLSWTAETIAHEWVHNYLAFHPLGWAYLEGGEGVTINETVASIVGEELGMAVIETYYPDLAPPKSVPAPAAPAGPVDPDEAPVFDFGKEMRATRLIVDALLEQGYVLEAESFMEARRQTFVRQGYPLRALNQAYFAFHGSYATGAASTDPIGPKLRQLRQESASLRQFLTAVDGISSVQELDALLQHN